MLCLHVDVTVDQLTWVWLYLELGSFTYDLLPVEPVGDLAVVIVIFFFAHTQELNSSCMCCIM